MAEHERSAKAAAYREAAGIDRQDHAVALRAHRDRPELEAMRREAILALEIRDEAEIMRGMAEAKVAGNEAEAEGARALAGLLGTEQTRLEKAREAYEDWEGRTAQTRDSAAKARKELKSDFRNQTPFMTGSIAEWTSTSNDPIITSTDNQQNVMAVLVGTNPGDLMRQVPLQYQPSWETISAVSSSVKARMVLARTLPSEASVSTAAAAVASSGNSATVMMSYSPSVYRCSRTLPRRLSINARKFLARLTVSWLFLMP
jgi:hypothetical protein